MRAVLSLLHRWFGLSIATFLFIAGLTGAIIAWDHELDALLNPSMYKAEGYVQAQTPLELGRAGDGDTRIGGHISHRLRGTS